MAAWLLLFVPGILLAQDGGGKDVTVAMFSTHELHGVTLSAAREGAWIARCAACRHEPLHIPLQVRMPGEWFAGGGVRVHDDNSGEERVARGLWHIRAAKNGTDVVLTLPSERYVAAVLAAEAAPNEPPESLRALAVLARTYALNGTHNVDRPGHLQAELCDSTACQAMRLGTSSKSVEEATRATAGETLWFRRRRAEVYFSQNCAGYTENGSAVWPRLAGAVYLRAHGDPYCIRHGVMQWHTEVPLSELEKIARNERWTLPLDIAGVRVAERTVSHRVKNVVFIGHSGNATAVSATALRFGIDRALGWNRVQSDAYDVAWRGESLVFDGRGRGHGVGLCQTGAAEMAAEGKSAREILAFYFPGTAVGVMFTDQGWHDAQAGTLTVRSVQPITAARAKLVGDTWTQAQKRFTISKPVDAELVFAPSTEMFRQLAAQPGWMLASTRGNVMVLQPQAILAAHGGGLGRLLLHEMLHVLVESEASANVPLWLREGLVEVLAGEQQEEAVTMSSNQIESALRSSSSWRANEAAHRAAAAKVQALVQRYGITTVRVWLSNGVPSSAVS